MMEKFFIDNYADHNASALLCKDVEAFLRERLTTDLYGNPNATHKVGSAIKRRMEAARLQCAESINAEKRNIIFNSGSSEGISHIFFSLLNDGPQNGRDLIIISTIEHSAIEASAKYYSERGFRLELAPVNNNGQLDISKFEEILNKNKDKLALVSIIAANNETGVIQPYQKIGELTHKNGGVFFSDTTQIIGKTFFDFKTSEMDFAVCSGHKIGAPTGIGYIVCQDRTQLSSFIFGGGQENGLRGGTQNYIGIECLGLASSLLKKKEGLFEQIAKSRDAFEARIQAKFPEIVVFGKDAPRAVNTSFLGHPTVLGSDLQYELEKQSIFVTTSSACSDKSAGSSRVLKAMQVPDNLGQGAVRISVGFCDYDKLYETIEQVFTESLMKLMKRAS